MANGSAHKGNGKTQQETRQSVGPGGSPFALLGSRYPVPGSRAFETLNVPAIPSPGFMAPAAPPGSPDAVVNPEVKAGKSGRDPSNPGAVCCIQSDVTGMGLIKRVLLVITITAGLLTFLGATSHASPIRPDVKKLLAQPPAQTPQYVPARAGWNGPEISTARTAPNPTYESLGPATYARELRASLLATMVPDLRILALLVLVILLLRRIRKGTPVTVHTHATPTPLPVTPAAAHEAEPRSGEAPAA